MDRLDEILTFFDPRAEIRKHGAKLPHWQQPGACYFVTFRLADSIPKHLLDTWRDERVAWLARHPKPWDQPDQLEYHQRFVIPFNRWLDQGHGECLLRQPSVADVLASVLKHDDGEVCFHLSSVIMPNHVHLLFSLGPDHDLDETMRTWKGVSARRVNQALGRSGKLWMKHYFDRLIRDAEHFRRVASYIRRNPDKANLRRGEFLLYESDLVREVLAAPV